eukprot:GFYU01003366.1.p1 GENE.GFYU01003366.1~~GFYU01003366.1.p1  ORF type:complete len:212 (-),score=49.72 GFYU01003366.1:169-738(-)
MSSAVMKPPAKEEEHKPASLPSTQIFAKNLVDVVGCERIEQIGTEFYAAVYADTQEPEFRGMFLGSADSHATRLSGFLVQQFGGSKTHGGFAFPIKDIDHVHKQFWIDEKSAKAWLKYWDIAINKVDWGPLRNDVMPLLEKWANAFAIRTVKLGCKGATAKQIQARAKAAQQAEKKKGGGCPVAHGKYR